MHLHPHCIVIWSCQLDLNFVESIGDPPPRFTNSLLVNLFSLFVEIGRRVVDLLRKFVILCHPSERVSLIQHVGCCLVVQSDPFPVFVQSVCRRDPLLHRCDVDALNPEDQLRNLLLDEPGTGPLRRELLCYVASFGQELHSHRAEEIHLVAHFWYESRRGGLIEGRLPPLIHPLVCQRPQVPHCCLSGLPDHPRCHVFFLLEDWRVHPPHQGPRVL